MMSPNQLPHREGQHAGTGGLRHDSRPATRQVLLTCVIVPFFISLLVRNYIWMILLQRNGLLNRVLLEWGLITRPLELMCNEFGARHRRTRVDTIRCPETSRSDPGPRLFVAPALKKGEDDLRAVPVGRERGFGIAVSQQERQGDDRVADRGPTLPRRAEAEEQGRGAAWAWTGRASRWSCRWRRVRGHFRALRQDRSPRP